MADGILVCGLNGSGKTTLGKALAAKLGFHFIDSEALFFPAGPDYSAPCSRAEAAERLLAEIRAHSDFILADVRGDYGAEAAVFYRCAVRLDVPREIRMQRIRARALEKFGRRMLPGGDLYAREKAFLDMAAARTERDLDVWLQALRCPILRADGTLPIGQNAAHLAQTLRDMPALR